MIVCLKKVFGALSGSMVYLYGLGVRAWYRTLLLSGPRPPDSHQTGPGLPEATPRGGGAYRHRCPRPDAYLLGRDDRDAH